MKLRIPKTTSDKMRKLSNVYNVPLQRIARAASVAATRCRELPESTIPTGGGGGTVIDVDDDHDQETWKSIIDAYCDREIARIDEILGDLIAQERQQADAIKASLPSYKIEE